MKRGQSLIKGSVFMNVIRRLSALCAALLVAALLCATDAPAQSFKSTLVGQVTDPAGAAVPGAAVTVTNTGTRAAQTATTDDDGRFTVPQLAPGRYELRVEAGGFKPVVQTDLVLETDRTQRVNVSLEPGSVSETVTVVSEAPVINTDTSEVGEAITPRQVSDLPLNGRNFTDLALLTPGVYRRPAEDDQGEGLATAGTRTDATNFILDGVVNRSDRNASVGVNTSVDSIREFKVNTSTYSAEYGRTAGAQINVVSKSGTNEYHGTLFEYHRNDAFDANNFFTAPGEDKYLRRNQFGGTFGGPLPFLNFGEGGRAFHSGKDRTFFFTSFEATRERRTESRLSSAPQEAWLRGDFRNVRGPGSDNVLGNANDTNRVLCLTLTGARAECPTPNVIPFTPGQRNAAGQEILAANPVSLQMLQFLPAANAVTALTPTGFAATLLGRNKRNQFLTKVDHRVSGNNNFYVRYARQWGDEYQPFPSERNFFPGFGRDAVRRNDSWAVSDTHIFSPRVVNEARVGYFSQRNQNLGEHRGTDFVARFGIPGLSTGQTASLQGFPAVRVEGFSEFGDRPNDPFVYDISNLQLFDVVNFANGDHNMRFGVDVVRSNYVENDVRNVRGDFRFRGAVTHPSGTRTPGFYSFADFLYGLPDSTQRQVGSEPSDLTGWQYAFFAQDDWRVGRRLTLNLGFRYELQTPLREASGRLSNFIPELGTVVLSGDPRFPESLIETDRNNWGPRAGFALRPFDDDRTVVRGGAGIYYSLESFNPIRQQLAIGFPFVQRQSYTRSTAAANMLQLGFPRTGFASDPFPAARIGGGTGTVNGTEVVGVTTPSGLAADYQTPEFYQYNLTLERELLRDLALEVGYVGSQGRHLGIRYNLNQFVCRRAPCVSTTGADPELVRPFPAYGDITFQSQDVNSNYNALQATLRRRERHGLTLLVSYTFSRSLDYSSSIATTTSGTQREPQNPRDLRNEYGLSDFHRKHQFSASFNYELPFGRRRAFFSDASGLAQALVGGWQVNGIVTVLSGRPFTPQFASNASNAGIQRPDIIGDPFANVPGGFYYNPAAFRRPGANAGDTNLFGNLGRNALIGPAYHNFDFSAFKNFRLTESVRLQFRAEAFNVFNHPNFRIPSFRLDDPNAGQLTAAEEGREFQFALKLIF